MRAVQHSSVVFLRLVLYGRVTLARMYLLGTVHLCQIVYKLTILTDVVASWKSTCVNVIICQTPSEVVMVRTACGLVTGLFKHPDF